MVTTSTSGQACAYCQKPLATGSESARFLKCEHCSQWTKNQQASSGPSTAARGSGAVSHIQPLYQLILLNLATFGLYTIFWFYRNWRDIRDFTGERISPEWRTASLLMPVVGMALVRRYLPDLATPAMVLSLIGVYYLRAFFREDLDTLRYKVKGIGRMTGHGDPYGKWFILVFLVSLRVSWPLCLICTIPLAIVQHRLNEYWAEGEPDLPIRTGFKALEIGVVVVGVCLSVVAFLGNGSRHFRMPAFLSGGRAHHAAGPRNTAVFSHLKDMNGDSTSLEIATGMGVTAGNGGSFNLSGPGRRSIQVIILGEAPFTGRSFPISTKRLESGGDQATVTYNDSFKSWEATTGSVEIKAGSDPKQLLFTIDGAEMKASVNGAAAAMALAGAVTGKPVPGDAASKEGAKGSFTLDATDLKATTWNPLGR